MSAHTTGTWLPAHHIAALKGTEPQLHPYRVSTQHFCPAGSRRAVLFPAEMLEKQDESDTPVGVLAQVWAASYIGKPKPAQGQGGASVSISELNTKKGLGRSGSSGAAQWGMWGARGVQLGWVAGSAPSPALCHGGGGGREGR